MALARALGPKPRVLLLDEPLGALDAKVAVGCRLGGLVVVEDDAPQAAGHNTFHGLVE